MELHFKQLKVSESESIWKFLDFSIIRSLFEAIFSQDVAKEGIFLILGNISCTSRSSDMSGRRET